MKSGLGYTVYQYIGRLNLCDYERSLPTSLSRIKIIAHVISCMDHQKVVGQMPYLPHRLRRPCTCNSLSKIQRNYEMRSFQNIPFNTTLHLIEQDTFHVPIILLVYRTQDTSVIRTPHLSGHPTSQDTSPIRTPHLSEHLTNQDTSPIRTLHLVTECLDSTPAFSLYTQQAYQAPPFELKRLRFYCGYMHAV